MTENDFIKEFCGELTDIQQHMADYAIKNRMFYGVGRALGRMVYWPLVSKNGRTFDVIDGAGYNQAASIDGRIGFTEMMRVTSFDINSIKR